MKSRVIKNPYLPGEKNRKTGRGLTLLEIVIAMVLVLLVLFFLGVLIPLAQLRFTNTSHRDVGLSLAESMMDEIRALKWNELYRNSLPKIFNGQINDSPYKSSPSANPFPPGPYPATQYSITSGGLLHTLDYYYIVSSLYEPGTEEVVKVTVSVFWVEEHSGGGASRESKVTLSSKIFKKGVLNGFP